MARSYTGQVLVRNLSAESAHISASYPWLSQKTGQVLVRTRGAQRPGSRPQKWAMSGDLNLSRSSTPLLDSTKTQPRDRSNRLLGLIPTIPARPGEHCLS